VFGKRCVTQLLFVQPRNRGRALSEGIRRETRIWNNDSLRNSIITNRRNDPASPSTAPVAGWHERSTSSSSPPPHTRGIALPYVMPCCVSPFLSSSDRSRDESRPAESDARVVATGSPRHARPLPDARSRGAPCPESSGRATGGQHRSSRDVPSRRPCCRHGHACPKLCGWETGSSRSIFCVEMDHSGQLTVSTSPRRSSEMISFCRRWSWLWDSSASCRREYWHNAISFSIGSRASSATSARRCFCKRSSCGHRDVWFESKKKEKRGEWGEHSTGEVTEALFSWINIWDLKCQKRKPLKANIKLLGCNQVTKARSDLLRLSSIFSRNSSPSSWISSRD